MNNLALMKNCTGVVGDRDVQGTLNTSQFGKTWPYRFDIKIYFHLSVKLTIHLAYNKCPYVYDLRHLLQVT